MNLDDHNSFAKIDTENMLHHIDNLPGQLEAAWQHGHRLELPSWKNIQRILLIGMGGSAIGADILAAYCKPLCSIPLMVNRDYDLPVWAKGSATLVVALSHSGNTEETLEGFKHALDNGCRTLSISTGGKLSELARQNNAVAWNYNYPSPPRAALGYLFGCLLAAFTRLELIPDPSQELHKAIATMNQARVQWKADIPVVNNPAKRLAGQLINRNVTVIGSDYLVPIAKRWKNQINEIAKTWCMCDYLPEADHNLIVGTENPSELLTRTVVLFLRAASDHPRNQLRSDLTRRTFMLQGLGTDPVEAIGDTPLAQIWTTILLGDYLAYYLAMAYEVNPTPVEVIEDLKKEMRAGSLSS